MQVNTSINPPSFTGCLTSGETGVYLIAVNDKNGVVMVGSIRAQFPIQVTIAPTAIGNLNATGNVAFTVNSTTLDGFHDIYLTGYTGYGITIVNKGGQNNTLTLTYELVDAEIYAGAGG